MTGVDILSSTSLKNDKNIFKEVENVMTPHYDSPENFIGSDKKIQNKMTQLMKNLYSLAKNKETVETDALDQLLTDGFDNEQIWSQIQLHNDPIITHLSKKEIDFFDQDEMEKFLDEAEELDFENENEDGQDDDYDDLELGDSDDEDGIVFAESGKMDDKDREMDSLIDKIMDKQGIKVQKKKTKEVDAANMKYDDFFKDPNAEDAQRVQERINKLELENITKKSWTMIGEAASKDRPVNSLLSEQLDFEHTQKIAPAVTQEVNQTIEEMIKKRIFEKNFDDVIRKTEKQFQDTYKKKAELNDEKNTEGLSSVYEKDYMKQVLGVEETDELKGKHVKIYEMYNKLCYKLDALTNFQFTPKMVKPKELNITTASAIVMEEKVPTATSAATMIAPEEVYFKKHADEKGESEMTKEDRKKLRSKIKTQWKSSKEDEEAENKIKEKSNPALAKKNETARALKELKASRNTTIVTGGDKHTSKYTKSVDFFAKLQSEQDNKRKGIEDDSKSKKKPKVDTDPKNFKL
eukprot:gene1974-2428_t